MDDPLEYIDFDEVLQHGDPGRWTFKGEKAGSGVPANSPAADSSQHDEAPCQLVWQERKFGQLMLRFPKQPALPTTSPPLKAAARLTGGRRRWTVPAA
jgi:hypothetical protein